MKKRITLDQYLKMDGKLEKIDVSNTSTTYSDKNRNKTIKCIKFEGDDNGNGTKLYQVYFNDDTSHRYAPMWIETDVEFCLESKYI